MSTLDLSRFPGLAHRERDLDGDIPPRVADLAVSFPLLFFMLASDSGSFGRRMQTARLVELGQPLADVTEVYGLPLSLRRIPPEACKMRLPWVRWGSAAGPQLANHIPDSADKTAAWLPTVFHAAQMGGEDFAIWIARQRPFSSGLQLDTRLLTPLALFAWHSVQPDGPLSMITSIAPWSPKLGLSRAVDDCEAWLSRLNMLVSAGQYPITDTWLAPGRVGALDIVPLVSWEDLDAERTAMRNCLHTYADRLAHGACRLFSIRKEGASIATLEINADRTGRLHIAQLKGPGNVRPTPEVDEAARTWLEAQLPAARKEPRPTSSVEIAVRLAELLGPYARARGMEQSPISSMSSLREQLQLLRRHLIRASRPAVPATVQDGVRFVTAPAHPATAPVHDALRARYGEEVYSTWFRLLEVEGFEAGVARVNVPVRFLRTWLQSHYLDGLRAACSEVFGQVERVEISQRMPAAPPRPLVPPPAPIVRRANRPHPDAPPVRVSDILTVLSERYNISRADLLSERRHRMVVLPRQIGMYLAYRLSERSLPEIGRRFGGRDHTTVLHAVRKISQMVDDAEAFRQEVEAIQHQLELYVRAVA